MTHLQPDTRPIHQRLNVPAIQAWTEANRRAQAEYRAHPFANAMRGY